MAVSVKITKSGLQKKEDEIKEIFISQWLGIVRRFGGNFPSNPNHSILGFMLLIVGLFPPLENLSAKSTCTEGTNPAATNIPCRAGFCLTQPLLGSKLLTF